MTKQDYNRRYYQKRKEQSLANKKDRFKTNVLQLFVGTATPDVSWIKTIRVLLRWLELAALIILVCLITAYLVHESAGFYLDAQESPRTAYMKAGIVEGVAILFSFSRGQGLILRWSQRVVVVLLCSLTLWTMTAKLVKTASQDTGKTRTMMQVISDLEAERSQKEALRQDLAARGWLGAVRKYERGIDEIRRRIQQSRDQLTTMQAPHVILNSLGVLIAFRLLILAANLICFHRIAERLYLDSSRNHGFSGA